MHSSSSSASITGPGRSLDLAPVGANLKCFACAMLAYEQAGAQDLKEVECISCHMLILMAPCAGLLD